MRIINVKFCGGVFFVLNKDDFKSLNSKGFGFSINDKNILLNHEAIFLFEKKKIVVLDKNDNKLSFDQVIRYSKINYREYLVYKDLKSKGYQVKSGAKFGFSFRVYDKGIKEGDDHSLWLVDVVSENKAFNFKTILGKNRVAHSTNKKLIFAILDEDNSVTYLENSWKRL